MSIQDRQGNYQKYNSDGSTPVVVVGSLPNQTLAEQKTNADAITNIITFSEAIKAIEIYHEELTWQTFTVNGIPIIVPASGYRTPVSGTSATTVTIPTGISCIVGRLV